MKHRCADCKQAVLHEDRRCKDWKRFRPENGAVVDRQRNQAIRAKCKCGHVTILIQGQVD